MRTWICCLALLATARAADDPLLRWMDGIAQKQMDAREAVIAGIKTVAEAEQRKRVVREKIMKIMGDCRSIAGRCTRGLRAGSRRMGT